MIGGRVLDSSAVVAFESGSSVTADAARYDGLDVELEPLP